jgi:hypothetical protein
LKSITKVECDSKGFKISTRIDTFYFKSSLNQSNLIKKLFKIIFSGGSFKDGLVDEEGVFSLVLYNGKVRVVKGIVRKKCFVGTMRTSNDISRRIEEIDKEMAMLGL